MFIEKLIKPRYQEFICKPHSFIYKCVFKAVTVASNPNQYEVNETARCARHEHQKHSPISTSSNFLVLGHIAIMREPHGRTREVAIAADDLHDSWNEWLEAWFVLLGLPLRLWL